jgi:hypothetical protein
MPKTTAFRVKKKWNRKQAASLRDSQADFEFRENQCTFARRLAEVFGPFLQIHPELWTHRTFLLIVAKIYNHLVGIEKIVPKEMMELTKALVEQCKVLAKVSRPQGDDESPVNGARSPDGNQLAETLDKLVREIYGANVQASDDNRNEQAVQGRNLEAIS